MRILDLDLDLFINKPEYRCQPGTRLSSKRFQPWSETEVTQFLEAQCGLSVNNPIRGRVIDDHHEAFFFWKELIKKGELQEPFEVVHADSHADIGFGDGGWLYLMGEYLHLPKHERANPEVGNMRMNIGNYLVFAIACGWLSKLTYVRHPKGDDDLMRFHFKNFDTATQAIELKCCDKDKLKEAQYRFADPTYESFGVISTEPEVPFDIVSCDSYCSEKQFDFLVLSKSHAFTPKESDYLVPVIERYIKKI